MTGSPGGRGGVVPASWRLGMALVAAVLPLVLGGGAQAQAGYTPAQMYQKAKDSYSRLQESPDKQFFRHNWLNAIDKYRLIFENHPESPEAPKAIYMVGRLYRKLFSKSRVPADLDMSVYYFRRLVRSYPGSSLADDCQLFIGEILLEEKNEPALAYLEYEKVVDNFPEGDMYKKAAAMVSKLAEYRGRVPAPDCSPQPPEDENTGTLARVISLRHWSNPSYTRVVVDADHPVKYNPHFLKRDQGQGTPPRLYIDLFNARLDKDLEGTVPISDGLLQRARAGQFTSDTVRVVLDMARVSDFRVFALRDPFRLVIDVTGNGGGALQEVRREDVPAPVPDEPLTLAQQLGLSVRRVVIDPGHGGRDPGAVGLGQLKEKEVTLDIGLRLRKLLTARYGLEVVMTREDDSFLRLEERTAIANKNRADLFVSIHCNSSRRNQLHGIETYFLNFASSKQAAETAALENMSSVARIADFEETMVDFLVTMKIDESSRFAKIIQDGLCADLRGTYGDIIDLGVKQAPFVVLIGAQMPSVLAEISFINHSVEGKRLATEDYRQRVAEALASGIGEYARTVNLVSTR